MRQKTADSELRQIGSNVAMVDILDEDEDDDYVGDDNDDTDDALHNSLVYIEFGYTI